jgi:hypothetical protein
MAMLPAALPIRKPKAVSDAELALWAWTAWICSTGLYRAWTAIAQIEGAINSQLQGVITVSPQTLKALALTGYTLLALIMIWLIFKIAAGKRWARTSLFLSFVVDVLYTTSSPHRGVRSVLTDLPDLGLQIYVLFLLYTAPGSFWFKRETMPPAAV